MMPVTIEKQIMIAAKATTVWSFIGTEAGLRQWWGLDITLEAKAGGRCEERIPWQGRLRCWRGTVTTYQPPYQLSLVLHDVDQTAPWPAWVTITLCLTECNGQTQVTLVQQAFDPVATATALGQVTAHPVVTTTPHAIWNMRPPQMTQATTALINDDYVPPATGDTFASVTNSWLVQQESGWQERLQRLAQQALLIPTVDNG